MRSNWAGALLLAVACTAPLVAQPPEEPAAGEATPAELIRQEQDSESLRWVGTVRARLSYPQRFSVGLGAMAAPQPAEHECIAVCHYRGLIAQIEPGISGGQFSIGWARLVAERRRDAPLLTDVYVGWGIRAAVLRTWGNSGLTPEEQTLAGIEGQFSVARVGFSLGVMYRLSPDHERSRYLVTAGIGWGF